ncbi:MAG: hypothetical protein Q9187_004943 [Circinaria calcarea]
MDESISSLSDIETVHQPFRFFDLPSELRRKIMSIHFLIPKVIDLDHRQHSRLVRRLECFLVSKRFHEEAYAVFFGINTFRLFPTHGQAMGRRVQPIMSMLSPRYRAALVTLELRLGPFWSKPPRCWRVTNSLGLENATSLLKLRVFIECDPSHEIFNGFRIGKEFYTDFAGDLLRKVMARLPVLNQIQFDGYPSVSRKGQLMTRLLEEAKAGDIKVTWGPGQKVDSDIGRKLDQYDNMRI